MAKDVQQRVTDIPVVGSGMELLFGNPNEDAHQEQLKRTADAYAAYRPEAMAGREAALNKAMAMFNPMQNFLFGDKPGFTQSHGQPGAAPEDFFLGPSMEESKKPTPGGGGYVPGAGLFSSSGQSASSALPKFFAPRGQGK